VIIPVAGSAASGEEIISWSRERLAHFKCPKTVEFADSLPRTTTGKVLKRELRAQLAAAAGEQGGAAGERGGAAGEQGERAGAAGEQGERGGAAHECTEGRVLGRREVHP
jgi:hypothetical protein